MSRWSRFYSVLQCLTFTYLVWGCGVIIVGNPHGSGKGNPPKGQIRILKATAFTDKFSSFQLNIVGIDLLSEEGDHKIMFKSPKSINWLAQEGELLNDSVPAQKYQGLRLNLAKDGPAQVANKDGSVITITNKESLNVLLFKRKFSVTTDEPKKISVYLNLDQSMQRETGTAGSSDSQGSFKFSPYGTLERSDRLRSLGGNYLNAFAPQSKICLYFLNSGGQQGDKIKDIDESATVSSKISDNFDKNLSQATPSPEASQTSNNSPSSTVASPAGTSDSTSTEVQLPPSIEKPDDLKARTDCNGAVAEQFVTGQGYRFDNLLPGSYSLQIRSPNGWVGRAVTLGDSDLLNIDI
jgi:hypothetical protein